jgi:predicted ferric reductase
VLVLSGIALGLAAVLWLWWSDTPSVHGLGDELTGAGRILGLMAGYGVVVLVALMARLPPLERGIGSDRLARWHGLGGRYVVTIIVAHALLITWGYAVSAHEGLISEAGTLLTSYPDVLMATVAGLMFVGIGLVSARRARRRMAYETWYYLHLYTYLAIALAFSHQFADGNSFASDLKARIAWSALYLAVAALVVWYRLISPLRKVAHHQFRVVGVRQESADVVSIYIGDHGQGPRRPQPGPERPAGRDAGGGRRPVRDVHRGTDRPPGAAAGGRGRHHPAAGHLRRAARPGHAHLPRQRARGRGVRRRTGRHRPRSRRHRALPAGLA